MCEKSQNYRLLLFLPIAPVQMVVVFMAAIVTGENTFSGFILASTYDVPPCTKWKVKVLCIGYTCRDNEPVQDVGNTTQDIFGV